MLSLAPGLCAQTVNTLAGGPVNDGAGATAKFHAPRSVAVDTAGNVFVADSSNHSIRKITAAGVVSTFAGSGMGGFAEGAGASAQFNGPEGVAVDTSGNVFVADTENHRIRKITAAGVVSTLAGSGVAGFAEGTGAAAQFSYPRGLAVDATGNVFVADYGNHRIRKITTAGVVTTFAGSGVAGFAEGAGTSAQFNYPSGVTMTTSKLFVADSYNNRIRTITVAGVVGTLAGSGVGGFAEGTGAAAQFNYPRGVTVDAAGNVFVADTSNDRIRKITSAGVVGTLAGSGVGGFADGAGATAQFYLSMGVAVDAAGNVFVADSYNNRVRKITVAGVVSTVAGSGVGGFVDSTGATAQFNYPRGVAVDAAGNAFVVDHGNHRIRKITTEGVVSTFAGSGVKGFAEGTGTAAKFNFPMGVAVDTAGNVFVADTYNHRIRKITSAGVVSTLAGSGVEGFADGPGVTAQFNSPEGVAVDTAGNVFVADTENNRIRKITTAGVVSTLAGSGGFGGFVDGAGTSAKFNYPRGVAVDTTGNVFVADTENNSIRKVTSAGVVSTFAGSVDDGFKDATGGNAKFYNPRGVAVDAAGNVVVADSSNYALRIIITARSFASWASAAGLSGANAGVSATPFKDGVPNLLKYAFNMNGAGPDASILTTTGTAGLPLIVATPSGGQPVMSVQFLRRRGSNLVYEAQESTDLQTFVTVVGTSSTVVVDTEWERVTIESAASGASRRFFRLKVTQP